MSTAPTIEGGCECGAVRYRVTGTLRKVVYCHCAQCRRTSGHFVAATACATDNLTFALVALVLTAVSLGASSIPAHRASKVAPTDVLRHD